MVVYQPYPDVKRTLLAMSERTGLSISQVTDEVLYAGLVEMQELPELEYLGGWRESGGSIYTENSYKNFCLLSAKN